MDDLESARLIVLKGTLFLLLAAMAALLLIVHTQSFWAVVLLAIALWASCRFYYVTFYVIQRYIDPQFRFSGLRAFTVYAWGCLRRPD